MRHRYRSTGSAVPPLEDQDQPATAGNGIDLPVEGIDGSPLARIADSAQRGLSIAGDRTERAQAVGGAVGLTWLLGLL